jgi:hypothetical protein
MSAYTNWTVAQARQLVQRELMDPTGKWWSTNELNMYLNDWQNDLQQELELVWGTATVTDTYLDSNGTNTATLTLGTLSPPMLRLDAVYYGTTTSSGFRLAGRLLQDLEVGNPTWRSATPDVPRLAVQYDSTMMTIWPTPPCAGTFIFEYPQALTLGTDTSLLSLPPWTQWSIKPYLCWRAYLRPGPTNDPTRAKRYLAAWLKAKGRVKQLWDNYLPERYRRLKPAGHYEWEILIPPPAWQTGTNGGPG